MNSITKTKLTEMQIVQMVKQAFGSEVLPTSINELTDGFFNSVFELQLSDGNKIILKVSPNKDIKTLRCEKNIMETEVLVLNYINFNTNVPVPKVLYYNKSFDILNSEYFFMEYIEGVPLNKIGWKLSIAQNNKISSDIGMYAKQISSIEGEKYGDISQVDEMYDTWSNAFGHIINDLLDDASDIDLKLPWSYDKIYNKTVYFKKDILDMVKTPSLLHKDLCANIFVDPDTLKINGIIDFERAIYGDVLLEPVCGLLLDNEAFMNSYLGKTTLSIEEKIRTIIYKVYLFLTTYIECNYRKYTDEDMFDWSWEQLEEALSNLENI